MTIWDDLHQAYFVGVFDIFRRYWRAYGGARAVLLSPYFHVALLLTAILWRYWSRNPWWDVALSAIPSLLGFTLAGFTIWLGFGSQRFRELLSQPATDGRPSIYVRVSAAFVHFVVTQIVALVGALLAKAVDFTPEASSTVQTWLAWLAILGHGLGFLVFVYAIMTALAAAMGVFRVASWQDCVASSESVRQSEPGNSNIPPEPPR